MYPEILLCVSQDGNAAPYKFKTTGIQVYSLEEAMYHTFHYWKQSIDDFTSEEFITWVTETLDLSFLGARMKEIAGLQGFGDRLLSFLTVNNYFAPEQLAQLRRDLASWEKRLEWERLKERGDYLVQKDEPAKALMLYKKALSYGENLQLLNNTGVALMKLEKYGEAVGTFEKAMEKGGLHLQIVLNLAEAAIYSNDFEKAMSVLQKAESLSRGGSAATRGDSYMADISYLHGELYFAAGNMRDAIKNFEKAIAMRKEPHYIYRLSDVYAKMRQYDSALEVLNTATVKDSDFLSKQAQLYADGGNVPAAIKSIERALLHNNSSVELWTKLAMYHRMDYDLNRAAGAIRKALTLDPDNDRARLESARINKSLGKTKDYQTILNRVLKGFKKKYRETYAE